MPWTTTNKVKYLGTLWREGCRELLLVMNSWNFWFCNMNPRYNSRKKIIFISIFKNTKSL